MRAVLAVLLTIGAIVGAGWLLLQRSDIPYETLEAAYAGPKSQFLSLGDGEYVHYTDSGPRDAPTLVMIHGFAASLITWADWRDALDDRFRVISIDLPGHGLTRVRPNTEVSTAYFVDFVDRVTDALDAEQFTLIGSSMGGGVSWNFALTHPERIEGLVLVAASGWPRSADEPTPFAFRALDFAPVRALVQNMDLSPLIRSGLEDSFVDTRFVDDTMVDRYSMLARAPGHRTILLSLLANRDARSMATKERVSAIAVPTLVLHGQQDRVVPVSGASQFASAIPGAQLIVYEQVGHLPQEEIAERSLFDLAAFLDTDVYASTEADPASLPSATAPASAGLGNGPR